MNKHIRNDAWLQTYTGKMFHPFNPSLDEIDILDIAHALSNICRFGGHCRMFYSVAQHSVLASQYISEEFALHALLHDASEAYLVDIPRPVKLHLQDYIEVEHNLERVISEKFDIDCHVPEVKEVDNRLLVTEQRDLLGPAPMTWSIDVQPYDDFEIVPWTSEDAKTVFLRRFYELERKRCL